MNRPTIYLAQQVTKHTQIVVPAFDYRDWTINFVAKTIVVNTGENSNTNKFGFQQGLPIELKMSDDLNSYSYYGELTKINNHTIVIKYK